MCAGGCSGGLSGGSGGLSVGTTINDKLLLGVGNSRLFTGLSIGVAQTAGTLDARIRFYSHPDVGLLRHWWSRPRERQRRQRDRVWSRGRFRCWMGIFESVRMLSLTPFLEPNRGQYIKHQRWRRPIRPRHHRPLATVHRTGSPPSEHVKQITLKTQKTAKPAEKEQADRESHRIHGP